MTAHLPRRVIRRCGLAVAVLLDLDLAPSRHGIRLPGTPEVLVRWSECRVALAGADPESPGGRNTLARWLLRRRWVADHVYDDLGERVRPVGLPVGHPLHPGRAWVRERVPGDCLDLGLGFVGLQPGHPDRVIVVPPELLAAAGLDGREWWPRAADYLEVMAELGVDRWTREPGAVLRPMGECDAVTLLGSTSFRTSVSAGAVLPAVVPMRHRAWLGAHGLDPAFAPAAAAATDAVDRAYARPLVVTAAGLAVADAPATIVLEPAAIDLQDRLQLRR